MHVNAAVQYIVSLPQKSVGALLERGYARNHTLHAIIRIIITITCARIEGWKYFSFSTSLEKKKKRDTRQKKVAEESELVMCLHAAGCGLSLYNLIRLCT